VALLAGVSLVVVGVQLVAFGWRRDLDRLPRLWIVGVAAVWLVAGLLPLVSAIVPARGQVLPSAGRGIVTALLATATALVVGVFCPPQDVVSDHWVPLTRCLSHGLACASLPFSLGLLARGHALPVDPGAVGAALGASAGAMGGLMLHLHCPVGGALHVILGHGGAVAIGATLGLLVARAVTP
jgi:hypothetical protein